MVLFMHALCNFGSCSQVLPRDHKACRPKHSTAVTIL